MEISSMNLATKRTALTASSTNIPNNENEKGQPETKRKRTFIGAAATNAVPSAQRPTNGAEMVPNADTANELLKIVLTRTDLVELQAKCSNFEQYTAILQGCLVRVQMRGVNMISHICRAFDEMCIQDVQFGKRLWLFHIGYFEFDQILDTLPSADELAPFLAKRAGQFQIPVPTNAEIDKKWQKLVQLLGEDWERKRLLDGLQDGQLPDQPENGNARQRVDQSEVSIEQTTSTPLTNISGERLFHSIKVEADCEEESPSYIEMLGHGTPIEDDANEETPNSSATSQSPENDEGREKDLNGTGSSSTEIRADVQETKEIVESNGEEIQNAEQLSHLVLTLNQLQTLRHLKRANVAVGCLLLCEIAGTNKPHIDEIKAVTSEDLILKHCTFQFKCLTEYKPGFTEQAFNEWRKDSQQWREPMPKIVELKEKMERCHEVLREADSKNIELDLDRLSGTYEEGEAFKIFVNSTQLRQLLMIGQKGFTELVEGLFIQCRVNNQNFKPHELIVGPICKVTFQPGLQFNIVRIGAIMDPLKLSQKRPSPARMRECLKKFCTLGYQLPSSEQIESKHAALQEALEYTKDLDTVNQPAMVQSSSYRAQQRQPIFPKQQQYWMPQPPLGIGMQMAPSYQAVNVVEEPMEYVVPIAPNQVPLYQWNPAVPMPNYQQPQQLLPRISFQDPCPVQNRHRQRSRKRQRGNSQNGRNQNNIFAEGFAVNSRDAFGQDEQKRAARMTRFATTGQNNQATNGQVAHTKPTRK